MEITHAVIIGVCTVTLCLVGIFLGGLQAYFFARVKGDPLAAKLKHSFITDALIYFVTLLFGVGVYYSLSDQYYDKILYLRIGLISLDLWANYRLFSHYKNLWRYSHARRSEDSGESD